MDFSAVSLIRLVDVDTSRQSLLNLLELQKVDSTIDRLEARRRNLPEQASLDTLEERLSSLEKSVGEQQSVVDEIASRQKKLDGELESLELKIEGENARLYSGGVNNPRELADLQKEIDSLKRRKSGVEETDLEVMVEREAADAELTRLQEELEELKKTIEEATRGRDLASKDIDVHLTGGRSERDTWIPKIDSELLELYDDLRASKGGVGAAAMVDGVCQGCHMALPRQEYERVRKAEGLVRCDECRRILVVL